MKSPSRPLVAIYDERKLESQLLHNVLERNGISVAFSCSCASELYEFLKRPPQALLINGDTLKQMGVNCIKKIRRQYIRIKIIVFTAMNNAPSRRLLIDAGANYVIFKCDFESLQKTLDELFFGKDEEKGVAKKSIVALSKDNPFFTMLQKDKYYDILKCLDKGKSSKEIGSQLGLEPGTIDTYIKYMTHELKCKKRVELVSKAKDYKVL